MKEESFATGQFNRDLFGRLSVRIPRQQLGFNNSDQIKSLWRSLDTVFMDDERSQKDPTLKVISEDLYSRIRKKKVHGQEILYGRLLPSTGRLSGNYAPVYWILLDNRVLLSRAFGRLPQDAQDLLARQITKACAENFSRKDDLRAAALAVTNLGHLYLSVNTQETANMALSKECAEANLSTFLKQHILVQPDDKVAHMYVYGALVNDKGNIADNQQLVGMCMRCVEAVRPVMAEASDVSMFLAGDHHRLKVSHAPSNKSVPRDANLWRTRYASLKEPSIIDFGPEQAKAQHAAWQRMLGSVAHGPKVSSLRLHKGEPLKEEKMHSWLSQAIHQRLSEREGQVDQLLGVIVEIREGDDSYRYCLATACRGLKDNAVPSPITTALSLAGLPIPRTPNDAHVSRIFLMGYNTDGSPLDIATDGWDRAVKRVGFMNDRLDKTMVHFFPLSDRPFDGTQMVKTLHALAPTVYPGSKQMKNLGPKPSIDWSNTFRAKPSPLICR